jgi:hypothetical protein
VLGWVSVKIPKQGNKRGLQPFDIGEQKEPTDLFLLLRALSNDYTATKDKTRNIITMLDQQAGLRRTFNTADTQLTADVFILEFIGCFNTFPLKMLDATEMTDLILDQCCRTGPAPDFGVFPRSVYFVPPALMRNRDSADPCDFVRRLFRGWLDDPVMSALMPALIKEFVLPRRGPWIRWTTSGATVADEEERAGNRWEGLYQCKPHVLNVLTSVKSLIFTRIQRNSSRQVFEPGRSGAGHYHGDRIGCLGSAARNLPKPSATTLPVTNLGPARYFQISSHFFHFGEI